MSESTIVNERKEALFRALKKNEYVTGFAWATGVSLFFTILAYLNFFAIEGFNLLLLSAACALAAVCSYYGKHRLAIFPLFAWIVWIAVFIRTRPLAGLRDITTNSWTLGPDLDPFLFLRWATHIVQNGSLMAHDVFRYVPLGYDTRGELILTSYFIAWFYKITSVFGLTESVTHAAVLYPVFMFVLTIVAFFFMSRLLLSEALGRTKATIASLIGCFFLSLLPALLPRTIAGIPEKEAGAFLFMFLAFYFFVAAWKSSTLTRQIVFAALAGISTGIMALVWGGFTFVYLTIGPAALLAFILGKVTRKELITYGLWLFSSFAVMHPFSTRYNLKELATSIDTGFALAVFFILLVHYVIFATNIHRRLPLERLKVLPPQVISLILGTLILIVLSSLIFGIGFVPSKIESILTNLITPSANRLLLTVAENRQPYFGEWAGSFGPFISIIPIIFCIFILASIYWFFKAMSPLHKKDRIMITASYVLFLIALIFSRYKPDSLFNGVNFISTSLYALGFLVFVAAGGYVLYRYYARGQSDLFAHIDFGFILAFTFFLLSIVAARSSVRTVMVLVPMAALLVGYAIVVSSAAALNRHHRQRTLAICAAILIVVCAGLAAYQMYQSVRSDAQAYVPSSYTQQWQLAMAWVRENTPRDAVFGHWWDYGYWVQTIGQRATVLDGGNAISYWNHLMGRYALTGTNEEDALEFLYAHNVSHFLIDSTDIGKYPAFASIGSNASYDRLSSIPSFYRDQTQVQERKNSTVSLYSGGAGLDDDIVYVLNGTRVFLPGQRTVLGGILLEQDSQNVIVTQPQGIFVHNNQQYVLPFRYAYSGDSLMDFGAGLEAGVFVYPRALQNGGQISIDNVGALLYLSPRVIHSQLARLYLFNEHNSSFSLVHSQDDLLVSDVKRQIPSFGDFLDYGGVRGPIRIWEVEYPRTITYIPDYLTTYYPPELIAR